MTKEDVLSRIEKAFRDVPMPAPEDLMRIGADAIRPDPATDPEWVAAALAGKRWQDLTGRKLRTGESAFYLMTPEGVHYFLPAFLTQSIVDPVEMDVEVDKTIWFLSPPPIGLAASMDEFEEQIKMLTSEQRAAVSSFFEYLNSHLEEYGLWTDDPNDQLTTYWQREH